MMVTFMQKFWRVAKAGKEIHVVTRVVLWRSNTSFEQIFIEYIKLFKEFEGLPEYVQCLLYLNALTVRAWEKLFCTRPKHLVLMLKHFPPARPPGLRSEERCPISPRTASVREHALLSPAAMTPTHTYNYPGHNRRPSSTSKHLTRHNILSRSRSHAARL
jgi:hypothetical protein